MKIIFLDIDGVMNNVRTAPHTRTKGFDPIPSACLRRILETTDANIVVSGALGRVVSFDALCEYFERIRIAGDRVVGVTPYLGGTRGDDITRWLEENPDVATSYILIDDATVEQVAPYESRLVQTQWSVGMTQRNADQAIALLDQ